MLVNTNSHPSIHYPSMLILGWITGSPPPWSQLSLDGGVHAGQIDSWRHNCNYAHADTFHVISNRYEHYKSSLPLVRTFQRKYITVTPHISRGWQWNATLTSGCYIRWPLTYKFQSGAENQYRKQWTYSMAAEFSLLSDCGTPVIKTLRWNITDCMCFGNAACHQQIGEEAWQPMEIQRAYPIKYVGSFHSGAIGWMNEF